ncbi:MAG: hypothetical protein ABI823_10545, partial [Bryobacteraceae bacterium]
LALYSLDHPSVPLRMVDFRDDFSAKRSELSRRVINDAVYGVAGVSRFGNWPLMTAEMSYSFIRSRHGAALDHSARLRSYAQTRYQLAFDTELQPEFRKNLLRRLDKLGMNPLEDNVFQQSTFAKLQYQSLTAYARDPDGLLKKLNRDRRAELAKRTHHGFLAGFLQTANFLSFGLYTHRERDTSDVLPLLASARRIESHQKFLEAVAASNSVSEVSWNSADIRRALDALSEGDFPAKAARAVAQVFLESRNDQLRLSCLRTLHRIGAEESRSELQRLALNRRLDQQWRQLARGYAEAPASVALDPILPVEGSPAADSGRLDPLR